MRNYVPVGIYNNEIFIAEITDGKMNSSFHVLRPVTKNQLDTLRDKYDREDEYLENWKQAVAADLTTQGFNEWFEDVWDEEFDEDDEEDFPGKDSGCLDYLGETDRQAADDYMNAELEDEGEEIGTWEDSGWYAPVNSFRNDSAPWHGWDFVFDNKEAKHWAKVYEKSIEK